MDVLHVIAAPAAGGAEVYVKDLSRSLVEAGHSPHIGFLGHASEIGGDSRYEEQFLSELDEAGIRYFFIGNEARKRLWAGAIRVRQYIKQQQIEIYHSHLTYGILFGAFAKVPRVYTHHNIRMRVSRPGFFFLALLVDEFIGISAACSEELKAHTDRDVKTVLNGVDTKKLPGLTRKLGAGSDMVHCIAVGRICAQKNYRLLVRAIASLPEETRARISVSVVGGGAHKDIARLEDEIAESGLTDCIRLVGVRRDVPELLRNSQLFIMTSDYEGLPIALIEASASGLPVVVTDVGGCREVVEACENGICVMPGDAKGISAAIQEIVDSPEMLTMYSRNALRNSPKFSIEVACEAHLDIYRGLLQRNTGNLWERE